MEPQDPGDLTDVWEGRHLKHDLSEIIDFSSNPDSSQLVDSEGLERALNFGYGFLHAWKQRVFCIRTLFLTDACIIGFKFLQPLCDANGKLVFPEREKRKKRREKIWSRSDLTTLGAHHIIRAYCNLLRGERITHTLHARPSLSLKSEVLEKCAEMIESHQIADLHKHTMHRTWASGIGALGKQIGRNICYPSARRVNRTLFIPQKEIRSWLRDAEFQKAKVTEHDLLVAFIFKVSHPTIYSEINPADLNSKLTNPGFATSTNGPRLRSCHRYLQTASVGGNSLQSLVHDAVAGPNAVKRI